MQDCWMENRLLLYWQAMTMLKVKFPGTDWKPERRYVAEGNIVTSGGQTSGFDAGLYAISQDLGEEAADRVVEEVKYPTDYFGEKSNS